MLEVLALLPDERIDRRRAEELFDLRRSAAHELLRRFGAERHGNALAISRGKLMARLRELQEHPDWRWERERRGQIRARIEELRPRPRRSLVAAGTALQQQIHQTAIIGLPETIQFAPGCLFICCQSMEHLVEQLVLVAQSLDSNYEGMRLRVESGEHSNLWGQTAFLAGALELTAGEDRPAGISSHDNSLPSKNGTNEAVSLTDSMSYR